MIEKIDNRKLNDVVYENIKSSIINNELKPGQRLSMEELSAQMGVSRTPISNALKALEKDNYVVIYPQSGTIVRELSCRELELIFDLREQIDGVVIRSIISADDISKLESYKSEFEKYMRIEQFTRTDICEFFDLELDFHDHLASLCPPIIKSEISNIIDLTKRSRKLNLEYELDHGNLKYIKEEDIQLHIMMIDAIMVGDIDQAVKLAMKDVRHTKDDVLKNIYKFEQANLA